MLTTAMLRKIGAMDLHEIAHRGRSSVRVQLDYVRTVLRRGRPNRPLIDARHLTREYLAFNAAHRFFISDSGNEICALVRANFPDWVSAAVAQANRICHRRLPLMGHGEVRLSPIIDWAADPVSGKVWPSRHWASYDLVGGNGTGEPKLVHEINRHQHLITLGRAFLYTGNERYAAEAVSEMSGWIDQNPIGIGINWNSSLEIAIRAQSWMWTIFLILRSKHLDERAPSESCFRSSPTLNTSIAIPPCTAARTRT